MSVVWDERRGRTAGECYFFAHALLHHDVVAREKRSVQIFIDTKVRTKYLRTGVEVARRCAVAVRGFRRDRARSINLKLGLIKNKISHECDS